MKVINKQRNSKMCFVCGMDNPIGLKAQFYNMEDGSVMTPFRYTENCQSFPGRVHGGLIATMLDELGLRAMWTGGAEDSFGVTMTMEVKLRKPVPYNEDLLGRGIIVRETSQFVTIRTELLNWKGILLAESVVKYIKLDVDKIVRGVSPHEEMCYLLKDEVSELGFG